jgi:2-iminobutanoate/2-iminopropanoate deaminase
MRRLAFLALAVFGLACASPSGPHREVLAPSPSPLPVFSPAVRTGNLVFLSGQIGNVPGTLELVPGGIGPETEQTLTGIRTLLEGIGLSMADVVKCTVFLADIADYQAMNEVYARFFPEDPPARSTLAASGLALGARVEIECVAAMR